MYGRNYTIYNKSYGDCKLSCITNNVCVHVGVQMYDKQYQNSAAYTDHN